MDRVTPAVRSRNMSRIRSAGTKPEMKVRRLAHALGYRFRLHRADLPGKPDLVFPRLNKVIFVHGCFWHSHGEVTCKASHTPRSNTDYWGPKLTRNRLRDEVSINSLLAKGWGVLVLWECELKNAELLRKRILDFLTVAT